MRDIAATRQRIDRYADGRVITPRRRQKAEAVAQVIAEQFAGYRDLEVVDFGCADGAIPVLLLRGPVGAMLKRVTGITLLDYNDLPEKPAHVHPRFQRLVADLEGTLEGVDLPWGACDLVLATAVLHYLRDPRHAFRHAFRLLRAQGLLLVTLPHPFVLRVRARGLGTWLAPNHRIRHVRPLAWWRREAAVCGFLEVSRCAIQWLGIEQSAPLEHWLRQQKLPPWCGGNALIVYQKP